MIGNKPLFDDLARVAGGAVSLMSTLRRQIETDMRERMAAHFERLDMVSRAELNHLQAQVAALYAENQSLKARLDALDGGVKKKEKTASKPKKTTSSKKIQTKKKK